MHFNVAAIVVTHNRKLLLKECLDALLSQTRPPDGIIIIDNASKDGTGNLLSVNGYLDNNTIIDYNILEKNIGGAGGFNYGIRKAINNSFNWVWLMDDDVIPAKSALSYLLSSYSCFPQEIGFLCSNVVGKDGHPMNVPQVDLRSDQNGYPQWNAYLSQGIVKIREATFVSVLIPVDIINIIGLPIKDFFIWGDDAEYTRRITDKFPAYLIGSSTVLHKREIQERIQIENEYRENRINLFYFAYRNMFYIYQKYEGKWKAVIYFLKHSIVKAFLIIRNPHHRFLKLINMYKGLIAGIFFIPKIEHIGKVDNSERK